MLNTRTSKFLAAAFLTTMLGLAGCGGGGAGGTSTTTTTTPVTPKSPSLVVVLTDSNGVEVTTLSSTTPTTVKATVKDAAEAGVARVVVTFSTNAALGLITPASATALTNGSGIATVTLSPSSLTAEGAAAITAASQVGTTAVTGSVAYSVGAAVVTIDAPVVATNPLSAFGTTSVTATVRSNGAPVSVPQTVTFSSPCAAAGKAVLTTSAATVNGVATASYRDNGCGVNDPITAVSGSLASLPTVLAVSPPASGSIQFVSATPTSITLKGMGGQGRQEASQVIFKVVDNVGNALGGKTVNFSLSTSVGGIRFSNGSTTATATSDLTPGPTLGQAVVTVNSGTVSTPVRVQASTAGANGTLSTMSDQLTITTGIPDQDSFSLSATKLNMEGWNIDGTTTTLTARLADHFNNPVPDNTAVNFTASGGQIGSSCLTVGGACSVTLTSQNPRPANGRVVVLAYAIGEESFTDLNGDGLANNAAEMMDINGNSTDMGEAFRDDNEDGVRQANEPFIDFNGDGIYSGPDGKFSGVLCQTGDAFCSTQKSIHVRGLTTIVFSGSAALISLPSQINLNAGGGLAGCGGPQNVLINIVDVNGNVMPVGTTIDVTTTNGKLSPTPTSFIVPNTAINGAIPYVIKISGDGTTSAGVCTDTTPSGVLTVTVKSPSGLITTKSVAVLN